MTTKPPASIGDALIFAVKAIVGGIVLIILGGLALLAWHGQSDALERVEILHRQHSALKVQVADLGDKLNTCLVAKVEAMDAPRNLLRE